MALTPAAGSSHPSVDGTFAAVLDWPKGTLAIGHSLFDIANLPLDVEGRIDDLHKERRVALRIGTPGDVELDKVTGLPGLAGRLPASIKLSGRVRVEAQIDGPAAELEMRGSADASSFGVSWMASRSSPRRRSMPRSARMATRRSRAVSPRPRERSKTSSSRSSPPTGRGRTAR